MAIQPIDLQALFSQVEKVGKLQANQKEGVQLQQAIQGTHIQQKTEERIQSVNESQDVSQGPEKVKDRSARKDRDDGERKGGYGENGEVLDGEDLRSGADPSVIHDPALGKHVDLSG
ncbi:MAG: hypothetical protein LBK63_11315 [Treponema sp.]|jgi:hypothetical protein|nr:hypothetical protein [Treponema sp.]